MLEQGTKKSKKNRRKIQSIRSLRKSLQKEFLIKDEALKMQEKGKFFTVTPINPFNSTQAAILELRINGYSNKEVASKLGYTYQHVKNMVSGVDTDEESARNLSKRGMGIYGVIEKHLGQRPKNMVDAVIMLEGDVILFTNQVSIKEN